MINSDLMKIIVNESPIMDSTSDAICILDNNNQIAYKNTSYENMINRGNAEVVSDENDIIFDSKKIGKVVVCHDISEINRLRRELERLKQKLRKVETKITFEDVIGKNVELQNLIKTAKIAALTPATILLRGESGTGKEIFANAIHNASPRRNEKFVKLNCSSIPEELLESELFGYKEGAFTGAQRGGKKGLFQEADGGTLFLDEIGDISPRMQVKLLRALQEREIIPIGSTQSIKIDVRIISATNKPLEEMIENNEFREDLYYRLNLFPLEIPPLRERKEDIKEIVLYLINKHNEFYNRKIKDIETDAVELLMKNDWPGNVRELENVISRALINKNENEEILFLEDIQLAMGKKSERKLNKGTKGLCLEHLRSLSAALEEVERMCILNAIERCEGDKNKAAFELDIPLRTLYYKCKKLKIR